MPVYSEVKGSTVNVKLWAPVEEVESKALDQLRNIASLPWVFHHVAAMADTHYGKGATVGSVIAMKGALAPSAVGVDIGCVDHETEFLSSNGWVKLSEYADHDVLVYDLNTDTSFFEKPKYIKEKYDGDYLHFDFKFVDQALTPDHRCLIYNYDRLYQFNNASVVLASDIAGEHMHLKLGYRHRFRSDFPCPQRSGVNMTDDQIRLMVAICADGSFNNNRLNNSYCSFRLSKERKIQRLKDLCVNLEIEYKETSGLPPSGWAEQTGNEVTRISFTAPFRFKCLDSFYNATVQQLRIICDEVLHWDGNQELRAFFSKNKTSADFMSYAFAACGFRSVLITDIRQNGEIEYRVFGNIDNTKIGIYGSPKSEIKKIKGDGYKYCFTTSTSFWVMRRNGRISITGNCGMAAVRTNLMASDLPDSLQLLRHRIEKEVPVGFSGHEHVTKYAEKNRIWKEFHNLTNKAQDLLGKARKQMGTLGGGNHFIEVCLDTEQHVWLMLHSGSRNIGKTLAEVHIGKAMKLTHNAALPDKDLAVFLAGTPEMEAYRHDLMWAQQYAKANREVMLLIVQDVIKGLFPQVKFDEAISCHHNYVSEENHFGEDVLVTRKGAVSAREGEMAIIPGSMGTRSYIVRGRGNPESFHSASHGAGRQMSRGAAKRKFTIEDLVKQTEGVECRKDFSVLDEIPGAYKPIEQVMANQADLVEIVYELKQVLCVKG